MLIIQTSLFIITSFRSYSVTFVQSEPNLEKSAKNESELLRQVTSISFQKIHFFEKDWQIASRINIFNGNLCIMSTLVTKEA